MVDGIGLSAQDQTLEAHSVKLRAQAQGLVSKA